MISSIFLSGSNQKKAKETYDGGGGQLSWFNFTLQSSIVDLNPQSSWRESKFDQGLLFFWTEHFSPMHRGAFCQFPFRWIYYYCSNKSTGEETSKTHLCAMIKLIYILRYQYHWQIGKFVPYCPVNKYVYNCSFLS